MEQEIGLSVADIREGLRLMREMDAAQRALRAAQEGYEQFVGHLAALYHVPGGYGLRDWMVGFEPMEIDNG